jgi:hypothetical protein
MAKASKKTYSAADKARFAAERAEKAEAAKRMLTAGLAALQSSDDWRTMLSTVAKSARKRFSPRRYSFTNQILLMCQGSYGPVATFQTWKGAERSVKKGEKARFIRQPRPFMRETQGADGETTKTGGMFFRFIPVFDLAQTDGEELPEVKLCGDIDAAQALPFAVETLKSVALGIEGEPVATIEIRPREAGDHGAAEGWYQPAKRAIVVIDNGNAPHMFKTLAHEVAHALLHAKAPHHEYASNEVEAESVAFIVAAALGFDTAAYSFPYVASWAGKQDAAKIVQASGERILRAANVILDALFADGASGADDVSEESGAA